MDRSLEAAVSRRGRQFHETKRFRCRRDHSCGSWSLSGRSSWSRSPFQLELVHGEAWKHSRRDSRFKNEWSTGQANLCHDSPQAHPFPFDLGVLKEETNETLSCYVQAGLLLVGSSPQDSDRAPCSGQECFWSQLDPKSNWNRLSVSCRPNRLCWCFEMREY